MFQWIKHNNPGFKFKILDYTYTSQPSINSALPLKFSKIKLVLYIIGVLLSAGFVWLLVKWSNKRKAIMLYDVCSLEQATHFLIQEEQIIGGSKIIDKITKFDIRNRSDCISFSYHERTYLFYEQKQAFLPIRYEELGIHLDQLRRNVFEPYSKNLRPQMCEYYAPNIISLPVQTRLEVFVEQMLTPYQVFQTYAILLWIYEEYYIFSFILLAYALYTYWHTSSEVVQNQQKLAKDSYFEITCKIIINHNDNIGAINLNDQAQIQKINVTNIENKAFFTSKTSSDKNQMLQEEVEPQVQLVTRVIEKKNSQTDNSRRRSVLNRRKVKTIEVNSKQLLPGDILILHEGDIAPCDCIILKGQILVDQSYVTGEKYLSRKFQLQNFTYKKQSQSSFTIFLGTRIAKIKQNKEEKSSFTMHSLQESIAKSQFSMHNQIVCLVINTNYNTLRGKYLRAIRHQKKQQDSFTRETIYFIYILIALTTVVFLSMISIFEQAQTSFDMFITYLDLIFTSIPPTLPTLLSVGINFAQHRLKSHDIHCVLPSNILTGGKIDTIVLQGHHALGKQYQVESMVIGTKNGGRFGQAYSTVQKFYNHHEQHNTLQTSSSSLQEVNKKKQQRTRQFQFGQIFINAISTCHGLQYFQDRIQGKPIQKKMFQFSQCQIQAENTYQTKHHRMTLQKKIYFKQNKKKIVVIVSVENEKKNEKMKSQRNMESQLQQFSLLDQGDEGLSHQGTKQNNRKAPQSQQIQINLARKVMFVKGAAEKILSDCIEGTYPENSFDYIVDMAQKGFSLICYAYMQVGQDVKSSSYYMKLLSANKLTFLGFLVLKQIRYQDNIEAIRAFKKADIKILLVSEQRQLQTSSIAILNQICQKKQLLLCSLTKAKNKIYCKGHVQWQSSLADPLPQFVMEFQDFGKNSSLSLMSPLYEELFMRRQSQSHNHIFQKTIIFNRMEYRHERNLYSQLQRRSNISFAVGGGGIVSQCANLSMELQRGQSSLLNSFHTKSKSLMTIYHCFRICRAGLATNFHVFSMMILFSLIQFTTVCLLYANYQCLSDTQMLYEDLFITFPIFVTLNLTKPSSRLSKQRPLTSFFQAKALVSMIGQLVLQFLAQFGFILYLLTYKQFRAQKSIAHQYYTQSQGQFMNETVTVVSTFVLSNYLYLGIVLSTSVSKPFRKPFYTNPWYTLILVLLWLYNTLIVVFPQMVSDQIRKTGISNNQQQIVVLAMIFGNLMMVLMYLYQNLLTWVWRKCRDRKIQVIPERALPVTQMQQKN